MKYVLVTGGVVSGLGKGVTASSVGVLLKACGHRVTSIKIGPLSFDLNSSMLSFFSTFWSDSARGGVVEKDVGVETARRCRLRGLVVHRPRLVG